MVKINSINIIGKFMVRISNRILIERKYICSPESFTANNSYFYRTLIYTNAAALSILSMIIITNLIGKNVRGFINFLRHLFFIISFYTLGIKRDSKKLSQNESIPIEKRILIIAILSLFILR